MRAALPLIVLLGGCQTPPPQTVTERELVICPETRPEGTCDRWTPMVRPPDMLTAQDDALDGADINEGCRVWLERWMSAWSACAAQSHPHEE